MNTVTRIPANALTATPAQIAQLEAYARTTNEMNHPTRGNIIADVLDALWGVYFESGSGDSDEYTAAENLVDLACALRDQVDARMMEKQA